MKLDEQISELLFHYDCVIIPEFGGFITNYKPAHLDHRLHLFHPPSKEVSFNQNLKRNDGLLANYLSDIRSVSFEEANELIRREVETYFSLLNKDERVVFKKVGILYRDRETNLRFQPDHQQNFLKDAFGLEKVFATKLSVEPASDSIGSETRAEQESTPVVPISRNEKETVREPSEDSSTEQVRRWPVRTAWAATLLLPMAAYAAWLLATADISKPRNLTIADLNPFSKSPIAQYETRTSDLTPAKVKDEEDDIEKSLQSDADAVRISFTEPKGEGVVVALKVAPRPSVPVNTYVATQDILTMRYHVVGGCFSELQNARGWVDELRGRGYNAFILDQHKDLYRVTFGNFDRRSAALTALRKIKKEELEGAWLLVRK